MKKIIVKLEDFEVKVVKLKLKQIKKVAKEVMLLEEKLKTLDAKAVINEIIDNPDSIEDLITTLVEIPKGYTIDDLYPDDLLMIYPKIMEVNNGFLELFGVASTIQSPIENLQASGKSTKI